VRDSASGTAAMSVEKAGVQQAGSGKE